MIRGWLAVPSTEAQTAKTRAVRASGVDLSIALLIDWLVEHFRLPVELICFLPLGRLNGKKLLHGLVVFECPPGEKDGEVCEYRAAEEWACLQAFMQCVFGPCMPLAPPR